MLKHYYMHTYMYMYTTYLHNYVHNYTDIFICTCTCILHVYYMYIPTYMHQSIQCHSSCSATGLCVWLVCANAVLSCMGTVANLCLTLVIKQKT